MIAYIVMCTFDSVRPYEPVFSVPLPNYFDVIVGFNIGVAAM
jgi:hypothetical protein